MPSLSLSRINCSKPEAPVDIMILPCSLQIFQFQWSPCTLGSLLQVSSPTSSQNLLSFPLTLVCSYFIDLRDILTSSYHVDQEENPPSCKWCENIIHRETEHYFQVLLRSMEVLSLVSTQTGFGPHVLSKASEVSTYPFGRRTNQPLPPATATQILLFQCYHTLPNLFSGGLLHKNFFRRQCSVVPCAHDWNTLILSSISTADSPTVFYVRKEKLF